MVIGMTDPVLGPVVMEDLRQTIRNCPEPIKLAAAGHFVQEWGEEVLKGALPLLS
jgi:pimeloyl-ACP methyl ester carboxylesterase